MDASSRAFPRRSYELPKPEADLAGWTTKIKAIQRQVDADEENEQKKLEEEIAAARQARLRRSRGGDTGSRANSADLSNRELFEMFDNTAVTSDKDISKSSPDKYHDREMALRKLMDRNNVFNPDKLSTSDSNPKPDSVPLASFIGGRATGPRLTRHSPQANALDSTQYLQPDLSAPHPIFGTGGVVMPGMTAKKETQSPVSFVGSEMSERYRPVSASALKPNFSSTVNEVGKLDELQNQDKAALDRPSFVSVKTPSSTLAQRYTDMLDKSTSGTTTKPLMIKRKSNSSIPKESPLSSPTKGDDTSTIRQSPSKSTNVFSSSSLNTLPNPASSYLRTKSTSSLPVASTAKNDFEGFPTSANRPPKSTSYDRDPIPTYSLPRNDVSAFNHSVTPLRRLMERNHVHNPDKDQNQKSVAERAQTTSLASFMGGSGKGIRLNKHAPQANAHDPTQFIQPDTSTPHPIFGKGGVAMPGMVTQTSVSNRDTGIDSTGLSKPSFTKKAVWPPVSAQLKSGERSISPQKTGVRARTNSTPRLEPSLSSGSQSGEPTSERSRSPNKGTFAGTPRRDRTISTPSATPSQQPIAAPYLARPIQPQVKPVPSPPLPATTVSPAFSKPAVQKDLTPSLSKLQGRGFVQNMVKASSQISNTALPSSTTGKKGSVLNRWQSNIQPESPPFLSRNATTGQTSSTGGNSSSIKSLASFSSLSTPALVSSSPPKQVENPYPRSRTPGLGSATTVVVIKPSKSFTDLSELGMKTAADSESSSSRKTPIYMTRDRTRKSQETTSNFGMPRTNPQVSKEHFVSVPQSAPAWIRTFDFGTGDQAPATSTSPLEVATKDTTPCDRASLNPSPPGPLEESLAVADVYNPREKIALPFKLSRTSSTGNRPSAMEVAQAFKEIPQEKEEGMLHTTLTSIPEPNHRVLQPKFRGPLSQSQAEKRKSTYEKYSAITLPPLQEEATPTSSPAGTLKDAPEPLGDRRQQTGPSETNKKSAISEDVGPPIAADRDDLPEDGKPSVMTDEGGDFHVELEGGQIADLLKPRPPPQQSDDIRTISVELFSIVGNAANVMSNSGGIFYDSEILAIVHRVKSKASGLASTIVWCWLGKQTRLGDHEDKKLQEISRRYGTKAKIIHQLAEPTELIQILGGRLAIRQGSRRRWTSENTTMHLVRSCRGVILIDEHDFSIKNMCSAFSYCFSLLGSIYVWHGCGSTPREREASIEYAHMLSPDPVTPIVLNEGENDADEIFWMMLGDDEFAKADYWRWRHLWSNSDPRIWKVDTSNTSNPVALVDFISMEQQVQTSIYVVNCIWELFVFVGKNALERRPCIRFALDLAQKISSETASERPYRSTIHVLLLPSQLPLDLRLGIRDLDEAWINGGEIPDYMNLIPCPPTGVSAQSDGLSFLKA